MYGSAPFGSVAYGGISPSDSDPVVPAPSGGGAFMLMGIRALLLVLLPSLLA